MIALTFDDGPYPGPTDAVLAALRSAGARATFFVVGERAEAAPGLVSAALEHGHAVEPHCHSVRHLSHFELSAGEIGEDLDRVLATLARLGAPPPRFWRPPFGDIKDPDTYDAAAEHGLSVVTWTLDSYDWQRRSAGEMLRELRGALQDGAVILMHDMPETARLVPVLVEELRARGHSVGPLRQENAAGPSNAPAWLSSP